MERRAFIGTLAGALLAAPLAAEAQQTAPARISHALPRYGSAYRRSRAPARRPKTGQMEYFPPAEDGQACYPARSRNPRVATPT